MRDKMKKKKNEWVRMERVNRKSKEEETETI